MRNATQRRTATLERPPAGPQRQYSDRQVQVLQFIDGFTKRHGRSPTGVDVAAALGVSNVTVHEHMNRLAQLGAIARSRFGRTYEILDRACLRRRFRQKAHQTYDIATLPRDRYLGLDELAKYLGKNRKTLDLASRKGAFPAPARRVSTGNRGRKVREWLAGDVQDHLAKLAVLPTDMKAWHGHGWTNAEMLKATSQDRTDKRKARVKIAHMTLERLRTAHKGLVLAFNESLPETERAAWLSLVWQAVTSTDTEAHPMRYVHEADSAEFAAFARGLTVCERTALVRVVRHLNPEKYSKYSRQELPFSSVYAQLDEACRAVVQKYAERVRGRGKVQVSPEGQALLDRYAGFVNARFVRS